MAAIELSSFMGQAPLSAPIWQARAGGKASRAAFITIRAAATLSGPAY
jgi:hypothetical protein